MLAQEKEREKKKKQCSLSMGLLESPRPEGPEQGFHAPEMHPQASGAVALLMTVLCLLD